MEFYFSIVLFAFTATITPGPNNVMIMTSGVNFGIGKSLPHLFGICFGFPLMAIMVGMGVSVVFDNYPFIHELIKIAGILYLLYLAWLIATSSSFTQRDAQFKPLGFWQAAIFQWVNPKAWVMVTGAVAAFTTTAGNIYYQVLVIALAFFAVSFPCVGSWLVFGVGLKKILKSPRHLRLFNISMALLLVFSILPVIQDLFIRYAS